MRLSGQFMDTWACATGTAFPVCQVFWNLVSTEACPASSQVLGSGVSESVTHGPRAWPGCVWTCWPIWDSDHKGCFWAQGSGSRSQVGPVLAQQPGMLWNKNDVFQAADNSVCKGLRVGLSVFCVNTEEQVKTCFHYWCVFRNCQRF